MFKICWAAFALLVSVSVLQAQNWTISDKPVLEIATFRGGDFGRIAGAALDVFETEPLTESPLFALDNVILTPHQAGLTHRAKSDAAVTAVRNALAVLADEIPPNLVNSPAGAKA